MEKFQHKNVQLTVWDVSGRDKIRPRWRHYFEEARAIIFVVASSDRERMEVASV